MLLVFFVYPVVGVLALWAANGFQVGPLREPLPLLGLLGGATVPLSHHLDQLLDIGGRLQVGTPAFLMGRYSDSGWWWYFPVAFGLKTPLPVLLLLLWALFRIGKTLFLTRQHPSTAENPPVPVSPFYSLHPTAGLVPSASEDADSARGSRPLPSASKDVDSAADARHGTSAAHRGLKPTAATPNPLKQVAAGNALQRVLLDSHRFQPVGAGHRLPAAEDADSAVATRHSLLTTAYRQQIIDYACLLIPATGYFAIALTTDINLGYRHLLPVLPFLYVLIGVVVAQAAYGRAGLVDGKRQLTLVSRAAPLLLLLWLAMATLWIHPHFLSFFNLIAGGPDNGWRALVDSNIDWGQDLARLKTWLDENDVERVWLSYFGEARPEYYAITYDGLDSFPPRLVNPEARPFFPHDPAPGWYVISATTLQGVHFADHDQFRFFREREPDDKVGYSIFLYNVPSRGAPVDLLLSNTQVDQLTAADFARLGTNDARLRWFDGGQAVVVPDGGAPVWLLLADGDDLYPTLRPYLDYDPAAPAAIGDGYRLYRAEAQPPVAERPIQLDGHTVSYSDDSRAAVDGTTIHTVTIWRQGGAPRPVKIYVHVRDDAGQIVAQWDGLGAAWEGWREGDTLVQAADVALPDDLPAGRYHVVAGLYDPTTNQRWRFADGQDGVELAQFARE